MKKAHSMCPGVQASNSNKEEILNQEAGLLYIVYNITQQCTSLSAAIIDALNEGIYQVSFSMGSIGVILRKMYK